MHTVTPALALQDTYVANGANWKTNYGSATTLDVATSPVNQDHSSIAMLKFDLTQARQRQTDLQLGPHLTCCGAPDQSHSGQNLAVSRTWLQWVRQVTPMR